MNHCLEYSVTLRDNVTREVKNTIIKVPITRCTGDYILGVETGYINHTIISIILINSPYDEKRSTYR